MKWINNLRLTPRLMLAFSVVMALTLVLGLVSYNAIRDLDRDAQYLAKEKMVGLEKAVRLADLASRHRIQTFTLIVPSSAAAKDAARQRQAELAAAFDAAWTVYSQTQPEAGEDELRSKTQEQWTAFTGKAKEIDELVTMEFAEDATDMAIGEGDAMYKELAASLDGLAALKVKAAQEAADRAASTYSAAKGTIFTVLAIAFIASILFAYLVGSSVVGGVASALKLVNEIAGGKLDGRVDLSRKDEIGALNAGMAKMQNTLQSFMTAEIEMAKAHEAGQLDHRIPADQFTGAYADMARSLNELVSEQISTMSRAIALMRRYAIGDLSEDMAALPGQKAEITDTMAQTKHNLQAVNAEIQRLVRAAADGDFTIRGDESQYQFAFQEMVAGLNQLMQNADAGLGDVGRLLSALSQGDLTLRVDNRYKGAFFSLVDNANTTVERLTGIARKIMESSEAINVAASEIASGNSDLSNRTEQQAANLEETASSMEELTSTVKQNAENSRQARQLAVGAADVAAKGGEVVGKVVTTMDAISASSKRIEDIISVIDGIAFQTNILALNAAVEAARAGEQGRGFAVVASEVRSLAQRSADAAKEIKELIAESVITVESGSQLVHQAGKTMDEIVSSVRRVTDIMSEIAAASDEQSSGIGQVNETIVQMDETTQQNAALVEQASAAARSMEEQANQLSAAVSVFRLPGGAEVSKPKPKEREVISGPGLLASRTQPAASRPAPARASAAVTSKPVAKTASSRPEPTPAGKPAEASGPAAGKPAPRPASAPVAPARPAPSKPAPTKSGASKIDDSHWEEF